MQKQILLSKAQARYEKICATRVRSVQQKQEKETIERELEELFKAVNSLKLRLRHVLAGKHN